MKNDKFTANDLPPASLLWGAAWRLEVSMTTPLLAYAHQLPGWATGCPLSSSKPLCKPSQPESGLCSNVLCPISSPSTRRGVATG